MKKDTNVIFVCCNKLNEAKKALINRKFGKTLRIVNISQIDTWEKVKGIKKKCVNVSFNYSELNPTSSKHFYFGLVTTNAHDILNFEFRLLDNKGKLIEFKDGEDKVSVVGLTIQIIE